MELVLGMGLRFYTSVTKGLKLKVAKFWGLLPTIVEVAGKKLVKEAFLLPHLNRIKEYHSTEQICSKKSLTVNFTFWAVLEE